MIFLRGSITEPGLFMHFEERVIQWNHHFIFKSINVGSNTRPNTMFFLSHLYNSDSFLDTFAGDRSMYPHITDKPNDFSDEFQEFQEFSLQEYNLDDMPSDVVSGLDLFLYLKERITDFS